MAIEGPNFMDTTEATILKRIEVLHREIEDRDREVRGWEQIIQNIRAMRAASRSADIGDLPPVTPGQYKGMRTGAALEAYVKARPEFRITHERAAEDLFTGGAAIDRGTGEKGRVQALRIALKADRKIKIVEYNDKILWLARTAGEAPPKRNVGKKKKKKNIASDPGPNNA